MPRSTCNNFFHFLTVAIWPLVCSIIILHFSNLQDETAKELLGIKAYIVDVAKTSSKINASFSSMQQQLFDIEDDARRHSNELKHLKEISRSRFIRLKGIPEENNEQTEEKIAELLQYLGFMDKFKKYI